MEFVTTDSKITINGTTLSQKRNTNAYLRNGILYLFFFTFLLNMLSEKIDIAMLAGRPYKWIIVGFLGLLLLLYIGLLIVFLFKQHWKNKIDISTIREITAAESDKPFETDVVLRLNSKRYKVYHFRTLENQVENFIAALQTINPNTRLVKE